MRSSHLHVFYPRQYSCLENPMDRGAWWAAVHGVAKSQTRLSDFTFTFHFPALEKEMANHSSILAWRIPGTGEPGGLLSMGSHRVGHDWSDLAAVAVQAEAQTAFVLDYVFKDVCVENSVGRQEQYLSLKQRPGLFLLSSIIKTMTLSKAKVRQVCWPL